MIIYSDDATANNYNDANIAVVNIDNVNTANTDNNDDTATVNFDNTYRSALLNVTFHNRHAGCVLPGDVCLRKCHFYLSHFAAR